MVISSTSPKRLRILRVGFDAQARKVTGTLETILPELPHGGDHFTRTIKKGPDGFFYLTIGSSCNVCIEKNPWRAAMIRFKPGEPPQLFASGLRNTVELIGNRVVASSTASTMGVIGSGMSCRRRK